MLKYGAGGHPAITYGQGNVEQCTGTTGRVLQAALKHEMAKKAVMPSSCCKPVHHHTVSAVAIWQRKGRERGICCMHTIQDCTAYHTMAGEGVVVDRSMQKGREASSSTPPPHTKETATMEGAGRKACGRKVV
jgi:hypothetical protein